MLSSSSLSSSGARAAAPRSQRRAAAAVRTDRAARLVVRAERESFLVLCIACAAAAAANGASAPRASPPPPSRPPARRRSTRKKAHHPTLAITHTHTHTHTHKHTRTHTKQPNQTVTDAELEARLAKLRTAKGATPQGEGAKERRDARPASSSSAAAAKPAAPAAAAAAQKTYDYSGETVYYEGPPHRGDLAANLAMAATLVWIPLTAASVGRAAFVRYRLTDRRLSVITNAPWKQEQTDVAYQEVRDVVSVPRGLGAWGDMVVTLRNGDKVEMRSVDNFRDLKRYILERRDALGGSGSGSGSEGKAAGGGKRVPVGAAAARTAALTDLDTPLPSESGGKGFSS